MMETIPVHSANILLYNVEEKCSQSFEIWNVLSSSPPSPSLFLMLGRKKRGGGGGEEISRSGLE